MIKRPVGPEPTATDPSGEAALGRRQHRLDRALAPLAYVALLVSLALALVVPVPTARPAALTISVAGAAAAWLLLRDGLDRLPAARRRAWHGPAHFTVLVALNLLLVLCNPYFGFFAFSGYLHAVQHLRAGAARVAGVAVAALPGSLAQTGGVPPGSWRELGSLLAVLAFNLVVAGVIVALNSATDRLSLSRKAANAELAEANRRLTALLAENAGLQAQLVAQAREAGVTEERQRLAREIHDTVAQGLAGIVTQLQAAEGAREQSSPAVDVRRHLDNAARLARDSLDQARRAVHALRPPELERAALPGALAEAVAQWQALNRPAARLTVTGDARPLHPQVEVTLLRAAQESLTNVAKHAGASRVGVTLSYLPDQVTLDVRDDGAGVDGARAEVSRAEGGGYGLAAMRRRAQDLGGHVGLETEPGLGTTVSVTVPAIGRES
ncbi:sensor histidine kinase [Kitasatospora sp. NPDC049258]|uniref:sensor histidine kinase n=1 Tax=Kitasatospora sp. NPDC049258 TaxID=3155394 RepID=UPI0034420C08